tara:strand:- start:224 stop:829 length:606 start_codon:yes stop_codon:yes gene_type:complete
MALLFAKNNSLSAVTALPTAVSGGGLNLISTQTASSSSTIDFTSGIDSTYKEYIFKFYDIHPSADQNYFQFNLSTDSGSNYNVTKTSTFFQAYHKEDGSDTSLTYETDSDLAQSTSDQRIGRYIGNDNDQSSSGTLTIFNPSSSVFVKHFIARTQGSNASDYSTDQYIAGYGNTASAINAVRFKMSSGNIDAGTIKMYGVS